MRAGSDMNQIIFMLGIEGIGAGKVVKGRVHLFKIPRIFHLEHMPSYFRFRRHKLQISDHRIGDTLMFSAVQKFHTVDAQILLLSESHRGPPAFPAPGRYPPVKSGAQHTDDNSGVRHNSSLFI